VASKKLDDDAQRLRKAKREGGRIGIHATEHYRRQVIARAHEMDRDGIPVVDPGTPW
jgi:hypothetical protein